MEFEMLEKREGWERRVNRYYDTVCRRSTRLWELSQFKHASSLAVKEVRRFF